MPQPGGGAMARSMVLYAFGNLLIAGVLASLEVWRPSVWGTGPDEASWGLRCQWGAMDLGRLLSSAAGRPYRMGAAAVGPRGDQWGLRSGALAALCHHPLILAVGMVISAHQQLAAAVVLTAVESLARQVGDELEGEVYDLHRQGHTLKDIA